MFTRFKLIHFIWLAGIFALTNSPVLGSNNEHTASSLDAGYSVLRLFLDDEQYLTSIRRVKTVITFTGISGESTVLIDDIADASEQALEELERLAMEKPAIAFVELPEESIGKATLDSLRLTTAKEFLLDADDFEKNLLLSQSQILRVISHLAQQLAEKETSEQRKAWLDQLAQRYENYYQQVYARLAVSSGNNSS